MENSEQGKYDFTAGLALKAKITAGAENSRGGQMTYSYLSSLAVPAAVPLLFLLLNYI